MGIDRVAFYCPDGVKKYGAGQAPVRMPLKPR